MSKQLLYVWIGVEISISLDQFIMFSIISFLGIGFDDTVIFYNNLKGQSGDS